ncbi:hypothetical protein T484DRAFT_1823730 [Baffinella frigidus]|nr:hypothetical protein T484DRAFT_1823730 [Cryptophyta sp. CCMP2293]
MSLSLCRRGDASKERDARAAAEGDAARLRAKVGSLEEEGAKRGAEEERLRAMVSNLEHSVEAGKVAEEQSVEAGKAAEEQAAGVRLRAVEEKVGVLQGLLEVAEEETRREKLRAEDAVGRAGALETQSAALEEALRASRNDESHNSNGADAEEGGEGGREQREEATRLQARVAALEREVRAAAQRCQASEDELRVREEEMEGVWEALKEEEVKADEARLQEEMEGVWEALKEEEVKADEARLQVEELREELEEAGKVLTPGIV